MSDPKMRLQLRVSAVLLVAGLLVAAGAGPAQAAAQPQAAPDSLSPGDGSESENASRLHPALLRLLDETDGPVKAWVFFTDKGIDSPQAYRAAVRQVAADYNERATARRRLRADNAARGGELFDHNDLPLVEAYVSAVADTGADVHVRTTWLNAVSVIATRQQLETIAKLDCVEHLQPVARTHRIEPIDVAYVGGGLPPGGQRGGLNYGLTEAQLAQINLITLHEEGYTGDGVIIGILDTGFQRIHEAFNQAGHVVNVIAEYDFVDNDNNTAPEAGDPYSQHEHGTMILGCIGSYLPGSIVGGAFDASFILCKTEDTTGEYPAEEDNYVAGLQFIEANGGDMATSSLGYIDWYTQADLDGQTAVTTIGVNIATGNGVHCCTAAGNEYHDSNPGTSHLIAPADAFQVITCGAVDSGGGIASFSSDGPTADGRVKPEVLARGVSTYTVDPFAGSGYTTASGTSLSTPLVACAVACLIEARPYWTVDRMRERLFETADYYVANGTFDPQYVLGYGIINTFDAYDTCTDAGIVMLDRGKYMCEGTASILVNDCGLNTDDEIIDYVTVDIDSDSETGVEQVTLTETDPASAEFIGSIDLSETNSAGVLWVAEGDTVTVTYIDEDDGQGGVNVVVTDTAIVDCTPPVISNVQTTDIGPFDATVTFDADEPVRGTVRYGLSCGSLTETAVGSGYDTSAAVSLTGLSDNSTYFYAVDAEDEAGNEATDDNGGVCYNFSTPDIPIYFTELFGSNDLANLALMFEPDGSVDFYDGCVEEITALPTDPAGGSSISLSDDDSEFVNLGGGETVSLYGTSHSGFYVGSNGYITFGSGDTSYNESLADHFDTPRISALFDDLNPSSGGTVSWKQLADRAVVTYQDVPEYGTSTSNTFQIEMYFDGRIQIAYLELAASDGLAGLSAGGGVPPEFYETDLSEMGTCGDKPPTAAGGAAQTPINMPVTIELIATDDGLPDPPGALSHIITLLPGHGTLSDPGAGDVGAVPYTIVGGGNEVTYTPDPWYNGSDAFQFKANDGGVPPEGGDSNIATISLAVGGPERVYFFPLDDDPGWSIEGEWAFGQPTGQGGAVYGYPDPTSGATGDNVYGINLDGDYAVVVAGPFYLTSGPLDLSDVTEVTLKFQRWLNTDYEPYALATVDVSNDGTTWAPVWANGGSGTSPRDSSWTAVEYGISATADDQATVYLRFGHEVGNSAAYAFSGWNLDDVEIWGIVPHGPQCPWDMDGDGLVTPFDSNFVMARFGCAVGTGDPDCDKADVDGNGVVDPFDSNAVLANFGPCP